MIERYLNFVDEELHTKIHRIVEPGKNSGWYLNGVSKTEDVDNKHRFENVFWQKDLINEEVIVKEFFNVVLEKIDKDYKIVRAYVNGQTPGQNGAIHTDVDENQYDTKLEDYHTFLYYVNTMWHPCWGGQTNFLINDETDIISIPLIPNSGVLFRSCIPHFGQEPTQQCPFMRMTLALKLYKEL